MEHGFNVIDYTKFDTLTKLVYASLNHSLFFHIENEANESHFFYLFIHFIVSIMRTITKNETIDRERKSTNW